MKKLLQKIFKKKYRQYGFNGTIHRTNILNVETDKKGKVLAVWFRCQLLPFDQTVVDGNRAKELKQIVDLPNLHAVVLEDKK